MLDSFSESIAVWVLTGLLLAIIVTLILTTKAWREAKRSPYFFQRRQALQRMQSYSMTSLVLVILAVAAAAYGWPRQVDSTPRVAIITNAKPVAAEVAALIDDAASDVEVADVEQSATTSIQPVGLALPQDAAASLDRPIELPDQYNQLQYSVDLNDNTAIANLSFSSEIDDQYRPIAERSSFGEGYFTVYATFDYEAMADGMEWSWVWRRDGQVMDGGNQIWAYGPDGPGYVYLTPEEGFSPGDYSLEIWINDQLVTQEDLSIAANAANN